MAEVTAMRYDPIGDNGALSERDTLLAVEVADVDAPRGIDLHVGPRTDDVLTVSMSVEETWRLARELARAASQLEQGA